MEAYVNGALTRKVDRLVEQLGIHGMTKDRVSAICRALDGEVRRFAIGHLRAPTCRPAQRGMLSAALREIFNADSHDSVTVRCGEVIECLRAPAPKVAELLEQDLLACCRFAAAHWSKLRSTNPLERVNREIARRADVVGIFPNNASAIRRAGALLIEQNDEWLVSRRYLCEESLALVLDDPDDREEVSASRWPPEPTPAPRARARAKTLCKTFRFAQHNYDNNSPTSSYTTSDGLTTRPMPLLHALC